eukprot:TRINITY_DN20656_c0_g1_i1.p1 TRINITY_DN20656_c0_g1~~TRINITY_DN20656_c0_g1_i1.p1  ORF type:complete len:691 (-),score=156.85 TRINITY_DN20656_c0_g1_i1:7-2079(-)
MALGFFEKWSEYLNSERPRTDSHLNQANNEYSEEDLRAATKDFDKSCLLGSGSFGMVYRGTMNDGTEVAIKVLQVPNEGGFEDEVRVLSRFRHPNLVILMGFARHAATGWRSLIYEFLAGGDVARRLSRSRQQKEPFSARERLSAALDSACGLSHLHNMTPRAFHRDIKSPNILLDKNGTAKMADFGLSCVSSASQHKVLRVGGTVGYACPEYIRRGVITEGSEVYSYGMVLLELLTGAPPAVQRQDRPGEYHFLVDHLQYSWETLQQMLDRSANFSLHVAQALTATAFRCAAARGSERPLFKQLVEELRQLLAMPESETSASVARAVEPAQVVVSSRPMAEPLQNPAAQLQVPVEPAQARKPSKLPAEAPGAFVAGAFVEARWRGGQNWYQGWILRGNPNGTFAIRYNDGDVEEQVLGVFIRSPQPPPAVASVPAAAPAPAACLTAMPACRLRCMHAEGVSLAGLSEEQSTIAAAAGCQELIVGRTAQPLSMWEMLVPEKHYQNRVSREHFRLYCRRIPLHGGHSRTALFLLCLSPNGLVLNGRHLGPEAGEQAVQHGDAIALATSVEFPDAREPVSQASNATAAAWKVPMLKQFLVFQLEVPGLGKASLVESQAPSPGLVAGRPVPRVLGADVYPSASGAEPVTAEASSLAATSQAGGAAMECISIRRENLSCEESPLMKFLRAKVGS